MGNKANEYKMPKRPKDVQDMHTIKMIKNITDMQNIQMTGKIVERLVIWPWNQTI